MKAFTLDYTYKAILLLISGCFLLNGCNKPQKVNIPEDQPEAKSEEKPVSKQEVWDMVVTVTSPESNIEYLTPFTTGGQYDTKFTSTWNDAPYFLIWAKQGESLYYIDRISASSFQEDSIKARFEYQVFSKLDFEKPFDIYGLKKGKQVASTLYYQAELKRGSSFETHFKTPGKKGETDLMGEMSGTAEILFFVNKTEKPVRIKHKGFFVEKPWFYSYADVSVDNGSVINAEQGEDVSSDYFNAHPFNGANACRIYSFYAPNGNRIIDAQIIMEIDGKEVRSVNRLSSDVILELNHCYGIVVTWDGSQLKFEDNGSASQSEVPEAVDMGLPSGTKWAPYNIGASAPLEVGYYYAWGEIEPKTNYCWETYQHADGVEGSCHYLGDNISGTLYDAAVVQWGNNWRMPTLEQVKELFDNCSLEWFSEGSVGGVKLTSRINGNTIRLPVTGAYFDTGIYYRDMCIYWTSTLNESNPNCAYRFMSEFSKQTNNAGWGYARDIERCFGFPIRPVYVGYDPETISGGEEF